MSYVLGRVCVVGCSGCRISSVMNERKLGVVRNEVEIEVSRTIESMNLRN